MKKKVLGDFENYIEGINNSSITWKKVEKVVYLHRNCERNKDMITTATSNRVDKSNQTQGISTCERVMASTLSVDEYFDELIEHVHEDYATL